MHATIDIVFKAIYEVLNFYESVMWRFFNARH